MVSSSCDHLQAKSNVLNLKLLKRDQQFRDMTCSQSLNVQGKYPSMKYFVQLSVWLSIYISVYVYTFLIS